MKSSRKDEYGNKVCDECMAHVPKSIEKQHKCPPFLKRLVSMSLSKKKKQVDILKNIVDDGTTNVYIPTPKGWKCKRKGCHSDVKHSHGTYSSLSKKKK